MSAEDTINKENKRRRGLRRGAAVEPVESVEEELDELDEDEEVSSRGITGKKGRATPSRRTQEIEETQARGNFITRTIRGMGEYFEGVRAEVQKVAWPTREEVRRLTMIVLVVMVIASVILGAISLLFSELVVIGIESPWVFGVLFVAVIAVYLYYLRRSNQRKSTY
jgi:preprotein translocase subunit SecE